MKSCIRLLFASSVLWALCACGATQPPTRDLLPELREAISTEVASPEQSGRHSRLLERVLESDSLLGLSRVEVQEAIGRGDSCSRHPRCSANEFIDSDWFYDVGGMGDGTQVPLLIIGFDPAGRVNRTWNLQTH